MDLANKELLKRIRAIKYKEEKIEKKEFSRINKHNKKMNPGNYNNF